MEMSSEGDKWGELLGVTRGKATEETPGESKVNSSLPKQEFTAHAVVKSRSDFAVTK